MNKRTLQLLTREEADALRAKLAENVSLRHLLNQVDDDLEMVVFEPKFELAIDDLVVNKADAKLMRSIASFKSNKSNMERVKGRLIRRSLLTIRTLIKKGQVRMVATAAAKATWRRLTAKRSNSPGDINKMLVETVEKMADKSIEAEFVKSKQDIILFAVVLVCGLGALAVTTWAVWAAGVSLVAVLSGLGFGR